MKHQPASSGNNSHFWCKQVDVLAVGGYDRVTALHEAIDSDNVEVVDVFFTTLCSRPDMFPSVEKMLSCRTRNGYTPLHLVKSKRMRQVLTRYQVTNGADLCVIPSNFTKSIIISTTSRFGLCLALRKYCSEFSLHFFRERTKLTNYQDRIYAEGSKATKCCQEMLRFNYCRSDVTCATDLRSFHNLDQEKLDNVPFVKTIVRLICASPCRHPLSND